MDLKRKANEDGADIQAASSDKLESKVVTPDGKALAKKQRTVAEYGIEDDHNDDDDDDEDDRKPAAKKDVDASAAENEAIKEGKEKARVEPEREEEVEQLRSDEQTEEAHEQPRPDDQPEEVVESEDEVEVVVVHPRPDDQPEDAVESEDDEVEVVVAHPRPDDQPEEEEGQAEDEDEEGEEGITGDTVMGFPSLPQLTNREIVLQHFGFVRWARRQENRYGRQAAFVQWLDTEEAVALVHEREGNEEFSFGQHRGQTFSRVAEVDPDYHIRYRSVLESREEQPYDVLARYIQWFNRRPERNIPGNIHQNQPEGGPLPTDENLRFPFGQHRGETFMEVARGDPAYHLRYRDVNDEPNAMLDRHIAWFNRYSPTRLNAHREHGRDLAAYAGVYNHEPYDELYDEYDDEPDDDVDDDPNNEPDYEAYYLEPDDESNDEHDDEF